MNTEVAAHNRRSAYIAENVHKVEHLRNKNYLITICEIHMWFKDSLQQISIKLYPYFDK